MGWSYDPDPKNKDGLDKAADGTAGASAAFTGGNGLLQMFQNATHTGMLGMADKALTGNDLLRPLGLNYDEYAAPGAAPAGPMAGTPEAAAEEAWSAPPELGESAMPPLEADESFLGAEASASRLGSGLMGVGGALGIAGGGMQMYEGVHRAFADNATEQDEVHGGLDIAAGGAGVVGGGLGLATALGAGGTAIAGTTIGALSATAAPVAAAIGLGVAGDHRAEDMDLWGHGADGKPRGTLEAAWETGMGAGDAVADATGSEALGAAAAGVSTAGLEVAGAAADVGLGVESLGASSGLFGTATNADGSTYNMGAFQALDHLGQSAGSGVDDLLGLDEDSLGGEIVGGATRGLVDAAGSGAALVGDVAGGVVGGVEAVGGWIGDLF